MKRVFLIVLDSFGIGAMPDAESFGDVGVNTLRACATSQKLDIPNMTAAGLGTIDGVTCLPKAAAPTGALADGTYEGTGKGIGGDVPVTVTVEGGVITAVEVGDNSETQGIGSNAIEQLPAKIVEANGTNGVEVVSGASMTSNAIFDAVNDCLTQASA